MSTAKERLTGISGVQVNGNTGNHHFNRSFGSQATTTTTTKTTTATATTTTSKTELTSAINSIIGLNAFTKGGAAKRVFKPTIPTTRRSGGGSGVTPGSGGTGGGNGNREGRDQNNSCNGKVKSKEKTRKSKGKKDLIQLDATFNGINITSNSIKPEKGFISPGGSGYGQTSDTRTLRSSQSDSLKGIGSSGTSGCGGGGGSVSLNGCFVKLENSESSYGDNNLKGDDYHKEKDGGDDGIVEEDVEKIQRVLYRDDFVPLYDPNEQDMTPSGWEFVGQPQTFKQEECPMGEDGSIDEAVNYLNDVHNQCLKMFVLTAFDMTRYMMITPKRIAYAKQKEQQLFEALMVIANKKQEEIKNLITSTITSMKEDILNQESSVTETNNLVESAEKNFNETNSTLNLSLSSNESTTATTTTTTTNLTSREIQLVMIEIQDVVLNKLNAAIADKLIGSVDYLRSSYIGTLERCLGSLENWSPHCDILSPPPPPPPPLPLQGSLATTTTATITTISSSVSSISQSRGQSQSSPSSLTSSAFPLSLSRNECIQASNALKQILNAAYQVEINMRTSSSLLRAFWDKMKQLVSISLSWRNQTVINDEWKRKVAIDVLSSLSESRLAKSICAQFKERLRKSHTQFATAMKQLENLHYGRLEKIEELRDRVRKYYAPRIARCALEATSLRDVILHGMPELGREIGRGQYGVVYSCNSWAGYAPVAVKSVVPPDEKHWNDLAMEFYYTRSIPKHNRIVQIRGSVIDYSYGNGSNPAVLLIMDRLSRDLYSAIKNGLDWLSRLQVAIDVVQGIRFLHSQGLVHRDIKLKNVLLDKRNRAKITDLGFCKPEAMMSGSIVGTPIHMAPELFTGKYDNSVDVYAFGILFWYICAGHVRLPFIFEQCQNKDQLWTCVRKGLRPERIPEFDSECWAIMEACWAKDPSARPYLGDIELKLVTILKRKTEKQSNRNKVERNEY